MAEPRPASWLSAHVRRAAADQRIAFVVVGGFNTLVSLLFFISFQLTFQAIGLGRFDYLVSLVCAQATSTFTSFLTQRYLVFKVRGSFWRDLARFATVATTAFLGNLALLPFFVEVLNIPPIPAQILSAFIIALVTYFAHRDFSFHRAEEAVTHGTHPAHPDDDAPSSEQRNS